LHGIVGALKESAIVFSFEITDFIAEETVQFMKIRVKITDGTTLHISELRKEDHQKYSYHWQEANGKMIIRWDNKPHWPHLKTYPDHRYENDLVLPSPRVNIADILNIIAARAKK